MDIFWKIAVLGAIVILLALGYNAWRRASPADSSRRRFRKKNLANQQTQIGYSRKVYSAADEQTVIGNSRQKNPHLQPLPPVASQLPPVADAEGAPIGNLPASLPPVASQLPPVTDAEGAPTEIRRPPRGNPPASLPPVDSQLPTVADAQTAPTEIRRPPRGNPPTSPPTVGNPNKKLQPDSEDE